MSEVCFQESLGAVILNLIWCAWFHSWTKYYVKHRVLRVFTSKNVNSYRLLFFPFHLCSLLLFSSFFSFLSSSLLFPSLGKESLLIKMQLISSFSSPHNSPILSLHISSRITPLGFPSEMSIPPRDRN